MKKLFSFLSDFRKNSLKILIFALYYLLSWNLYFANDASAGGMWNSFGIAFRERSGDSIPLFLNTG